MLNKPLSIGEPEANGHPGLTLQNTPVLPPEYRLELYRLYHPPDASVQITLNGQPHVLSQGHLLTLSPGDDVRFGSGSKLRSLCFHHDFFCVRVQRDEVFCDGIVFNRLAGLPIVRLNVDEQTQLQTRLDEMHSVLSKPGVLAREHIINKLRDLLLLAAEAKIRDIAGAVDQEIQPTPLSPLVLEFQHLVESHYHQKTSVAFYCERLHVTPVTLNRHVKAELGQTVMEVVSERLAIAAREALRSGERSVKQVAIDLGFDDPLYFSRFFRKHFGLPPSHYFEQGLSDQS